MNLFKAVTLSFAFLTINLNVNAMPTTYAKYKDGCKYHYYYTKGQEELHEAKKRHIALLVAIQKNDYAEMKKILKDR